MATVWRAMRGDPRRFVLSWWPLRSLGYLLGTVPIALMVLLALALAVLFPPAWAFAGLPVGAVERRRLRLIDPEPVPSPHVVPPPGLPGWLRCRLGEAATWREFGYALALATVLSIVDLVAVVAFLSCLLFFAAPAIVASEGVFRVGPVAVHDAAGGWAMALVAGPIVMVAGIYALCAFAGAQAGFARWLLTPSEAELGRRVDELSRSRTRLVNAFEAERRRIERDLHDGAQQHLVLLNMSLGLARIELTDRESRAAALIADAHQQAREALVAIRELIRGIHPQVLTDLGLAAAIGELAERCPVPVELDLAALGRLPTAVESTAYFVVAEALTNAVKHAGPNRIRVSATADSGRLTVLITDDGTGGADPARGTGLRGLADRVAVMAGVLAVTSPVGGPTTLRLELPCRFG